MSPLSPPERVPDALKPIDRQILAVAQPLKVRALLDDLNMIAEYEGKVSEITGEDRSGDLGSAGSATGSRRDDGSAISARAAAIANIPPAPVMQQKIEEHIQGEIKQLEKLSKAVARSGDPGAAYHLNELYAKIRKLNSLLASLVEASIDVMKRIFIRIFIDKQPIFSS